MKNSYEINQEILCIRKADKVKSHDIESTTNMLIKTFFKQISKNNSKIIDGERIYDLTKNPSSSNAVASYSVPRLNTQKKSVETRWEAFAKRKGIISKKSSSSKKVFSEETGKWEFRYGSKSIKNQKLAGGVVEVKQSISKMKRDKQKRIDHNIKKMLKNRERNRNK